MVIISLLAFRCKHPFAQTPPAPPCRVVVFARAVWNGERLAPPAMRSRRPTGATGALTESAGGKRGASSARKRPRRAGPNRRPPAPTTRSARIDVEGPLTVASEHGTRGRGKGGSAGCRGRRELLASLAGAAKHSPSAARTTSPTCKQTRERDPPRAVGGLRAENVVNRAQPSRTFVAHVVRAQFRASVARLGPGCRGDRGKSTVRAPIAHADRALLRAQQSRAIRALPSCFLRLFRAHSRLPMAARISDNRGLSSPIMGQILRILRARLVNMLAVDTT